MNTKQKSSTLLLFTFLFSMLLSPPVISQNNSMKYGEVSMKEMNMKVCPIDSTAGAFTIFDIGNSWFGSSNGKLSVHVRTKILSTDELDRGSFDISYPNGTRVERFKAATYNLVDGKIVADEIKRKDTYTEEVNDYVKAMKVSLPNVKEGSVIEYQYTLTMGDIFSLNSWYFQSSIPVLYSEYNLEHPAGINYKVMPSGYIPMSAVNRDVKTKSGMNYIMLQYIAENIPAFKLEEYMPSESDYISKIEFEIESVNLPGYRETILPASYKALSKKMFPIYEEDMKRDFFMVDQVKAITSEATTNEAKIRAWYYYVQKNFKISSENSDRTLKKVFEDKEGNSFQVKQLFIMGARSLGFRSDLLATSTRSNGRMHPFIPLMDDVNYFLAYLNDGTKEYFLDPSSKNVPFGMLPFKCSNGLGFIIAEMGGKKVQLTTLADKYIEQSVGEFTLDESGVMAGTLSIKQSGYRAVTTRNKINETGEEEYKENIIENYEEWEIGSHEIVGLDDIEDAIQEHFEIETSKGVEFLGDIIYVNPLIYGGWKENLFKTEERIYPIDYGAKIVESYTYTIQIPEDFIVDEKPKPVAMALPQNAGRFVFNTVVMGNKIMITNQFQINKTLFVSEEYPYLKKLYDEMIAKQSETIVLKRKTEE